MEELIIKEHKTREDLVQLINNSGLPAIMLKPMIKELYDQLEILTQQQYEQAKNIVELKKEEQNGQD